MHPRNEAEIRRIGKMMPSTIRNIAIKKVINDPEMVDAPDYMVKKLIRGDVDRQPYKESERAEALKRWQEVNEEAKKEKEIVDEKKEIILERWWEKRISEAIESGRLRPELDKKSADRFMKEIRKR